MKSLKTFTPAFAMALTLFPIIVASAAKADIVQSLRPYLGIDLQRMQFDYNKNYNSDGDILDAHALLEDGLNGGNVHIGIRPVHYAGFELGYFQTLDEDKNIPAGQSIGPGLVTATSFSTQVKLRGFILDALGYLPITQDGGIELIGTAGLSWSKADITLNIPGEDSEAIAENEIGFRAGGGVQFAVTDTLNIRGLARYQSADFDAIADNAWVYSVGINYSF